MQGDDVYASGCQDVPRYVDLLMIFDGLYLNSEVRSAPFL